MKGKRLFFPAVRGVWDGGSVTCLEWCALGTLGDGRSQVSPAMVVGLILTCPLLTHAVSMYVNVLVAGWISHFINRMKC